MKRAQQELYSFCQQFDLSQPKPTCNGSYSKPTTSKPNKPPHKRIAHKYKKHLYTKIKPYYKKTIKKPTKPFQSKSKLKPKFDPKTLPITNVVRKVMPLDFVGSIQNYMNYIFKRGSHLSYPKPFD
jgi:hypothetical protein